jgi:alpha-glucosidase
VAELDAPHHDGSELYVLEQPDELGGEATVRLRVPRAVAVDEVGLRYVRDGEPRSVLATVDEQTEAETWWRATFPVWNPVTSYRWVLAGGDVGYGWVSGAGLVPHDTPDADDFILSLGGNGPAWHLRSVVYQIFPDRFAASGRNGSRPEWAVPRAWDELPTGRGPATPHELFGGDLAGIEAHLEHVEQLGANVIYLTPIFPAGSTHRYDANTFDHVDPLLGGDEALASLTAAAHRRGMRVVGDLTLNHVGVGHDWFVAARESPDAAERELFYFDERLPHGYEAWLGVRTLPKVNWSSPELRSRMATVARRWLEPPFELDGWRIDVANMVGRYGELGLTADVAREMRSAVDSDGETLLIAEHGHDYRADLLGDGWNGTMNYAGFLRPAWTWLRGPTIPEPLEHAFWGIPVGLPTLPGSAAVATMRAFRAGLPWTSVLQSWTLLDSHDTARFRTVAGSRERQLVGIGLQMTTPGVPMVFAGDELGLEGEWGEDARRTMPWASPERWDTELLAEYRSLIALRRESEALARGGIRYAHVGDDAIAYLRETAAERLLCLAARAKHEPVRLPLAALGASELETLYGADARVVRGDVFLPGDGPAFHVWRLR